MSWLSKLIGLDRNPKLLVPINQSLRLTWSLGGNRWVENAFRKAAKRAGLTVETADAIWRDVEAQVRTW